MTEPIDFQKGVTLLGLGPGEAGLLTRQAWSWLERVKEVTLLEEAEDLQGGLPAGTQVNVLALVEEGSTLDLDEIAYRVVSLGQRPQGVTLGLPGTPGEGGDFVETVKRLAREAELPVQVIPGLGLLLPALAAAGLSAAPHATLVAASRLTGEHVPSFPATAPAVITQVSTPEAARELQRVLSAVYPPDHPVVRVSAPGGVRQSIVNLPLKDLGEQGVGGPFTALVVPPLGEGASLEAFQEIVAHLRAPDGCPWDRAQSHRTLRTNLLEETYEALEALDLNDPRAMAEEFGDLLLQIVLNAQIASEAGEFNLTDIVSGISSKIVRRHPHVFGDVTVEGVKGVLQNWEKLKAAEREANGEVAGKKGLLDGVPGILPALNQAQELQDRAARVGFDWPSVQGVLDKIHEELGEVAEAPDPEALAGEIGDLLFAVVNLARWKKVDAESALRETSTRFRRRFAHIEQAARDQGRTLQEMTLEEMDALWEEAKRLSAKGAKGAKENEG